MIPSEQLDRPPANLADAEALRVLYKRQYQQLLAAGAMDVRVTCPCGVTIAVAYAYKCLYCGLWFCRACAARHFSHSGASGAAGGSTQ